MLSLAIAAPLWMLRGQGRTRKQKIAMGAVVLAMVPFMAGKQIQERFFSIGEYQKDDSAQSRLTSWKIGLRIAAENPVFGIGVRNSPLFTKAYGADMEGRTIHSQYIQLAADTGFIGMLLYVAVVGFSMWDLQRVIRAAKGRGDPDSERAYFAAVGMQAALGTFVVGAVFLSCEAFEPQYYMFLFAAQLRLAYLSASAPAPGPVRRPVPHVPLAPPTPAQAHP
jgi:O-antigen ligase